MNKKEIHGVVADNGCTSQVRAMAGALITSKKKFFFLFLNIYRFDSSFQLLWELSNPNHLT